MKENNVAVKAVGAILKITLAAVLILLIYNGAMKAYAFGYQIFAEEPMSTGTGTTVSVTIVEGKSVMEIGEILEEKGLISSANLFYFQEMFSSYKDEIAPGVYELNTSMKPQEMMAVMAAVPEGASEETTE